MIEKVKRILNKAKQENRWLLEPEAMEVLGAYGIDVPESHFVSDYESAEKAARAIGFPVVLKIVSPQILHKSDAGCVKLNLKNTTELKNAYQAILTNARKFNAQAEIKGMMIYPMVKSGLETIIGVTNDAQFGLAIMFGLGGIFVEVLKDVTFRIVPLTKQDALEMISETKGYKLLQGTRGTEPRDINALADTILKISNLCRNFPMINEIDLNPTYVYEQGVLVVDVRISVGKNDSA